MSGQTGQLDNYYYPVRDFFSEKTYCFVNQNDKAEKSYWKMKTAVSNNDTAPSS